MSDLWQAFFQKLRRQSTAAHHHPTVASAVAVIEQAVHIASQTHAKEERRRLKHKPTTAAEQNSIHKNVVVVSGATFHESIVRQLALVLATLPDPKVQQWARDVLTSVLFGSTDVNQLPRNTDSIDASRADRNGNAAATNCFFGEEVASKRLTQEEADDLSGYLSERGLLRSSSPILQSFQELLLSMPTTKPTTTTSAPPSLPQQTTKESERTANNKSGSSGATAATTKSSTPATKLAVVCTVGIAPFSRVTLMNQIHLSGSYLRDPNGERTIPDASLHTLVLAERCERLLKLWSDPKVENIHHGVGSALSQAKFVTRGRLVLLVGESNVIGTPEYCAENHVAVQRKNAPSSASAEEGGAAAPASGSPNQSNNNNNNNKRANPVMLIRGGRSQRTILRSVSAAAPPSAKPHRSAAAATNTNSLEAVTVLDTHGFYGCSALDSAAAMDMLFVTRQYTSMASQACVQHAESLKAKQPTKQQQSATASNSTVDVKSNTADNEGKQRACVVIQLVVYVDTSSPTFSLTTVRMLREKLLPRLHELQQTVGGQRKAGPHLDVDVHLCCHVMFSGSELVPMLLPPLSSDPATAAGVEHGSSPHHQTTPVASALTQELQSLIRQFPLQVALNLPTSTLFSPTIAADLFHMRDESEANLKTTAAAGGESASTNGGGARTAQLFPSSVTVQYTPLQQQQTTSASSHNEEESRLPLGYVSLHIPTEYAEQCALAQFLFQCWSVSPLSISEIQSCRAPPAPTSSNQKKRQRIDQGDLNDNKNNNHNNDVQEQKKNLPPQSAAHPPPPQSFDSADDDEEEGESESNSEGAYRKKHESTTPSTANDRGELFDEEEDVLPLRAPLVYQQDAYVRAIRKLATVAANSAKLTVYDTDPPTALEEDDRDFRTRLQRSHLAARCEPAHAARSTIPRPLAVASIECRRANSLVPYEFRLCFADHSRIIYFARAIPFASMNDNTLRLMLVSLLSSFGITTAMYEPDLNVLLRTSSLDPLKEVRWVDSTLWNVAAALPAAATVIPRLGTTTIADRSQRSEGEGAATRREGALEIDASNAAAVAAEQQQAKSSRKSPASPLLLKAMEETKAKLRAMQQNNNNNNNNSDTDMNQDHPTTTTTRSEEEEQDDNGEPAMSTRQTLICGLPVEGTRPLALCIGFSPLKDMPLFGEEFLLGRQEVELRRQLRWVLGCLWPVSAALRQLLVQQIVPRSCSSSPPPTATTATTTALGTSSTSSDLWRILVSKQFDLTSKLAHYFSNRRELFLVPVGYDDSDEVFLQETTEQRLHPLGGVTALTVPIGRLFLIPQLFYRAAVEHSTVQLLRPASHAAAALATITPALHSLRQNDELCERYRLQYGDADLLYPLCFEPEDAEAVSSVTNMFFKVLHRSLAASRAGRGSVVPQEPCDGGPPPPPVPTLSPHVSRYVQVRLRPASMMHHSPFYPWSTQHARSPSGGPLLPSVELQLVAQTGPVLFPPPPPLPTAATATGHGDGATTMASVDDSTFDDVFSDLSSTMQQIAQWLDACATYVVQESPDVRRAMEQTIVRAIHTAEQLLHNPRQTGGYFTMGDGSSSSVQQGTTGTGGSSGNHSMTTMAASEMSALGVMVASAPPSSAMHSHSSSRQHRSFVIHHNPEPELDEEEEEEVDDVGAFSASSDRASSDGSAPSREEDGHPSSKLSPPPSTQKQRGSGGGGWLWGWWGGGGNGGQDAPSSLTFDLSSSKLRQN